MKPSNHTLFQDPKVKYPAEFQDLSFSDYMAQCKALVENTRLDLLNNPEADRIIEANTPFELLPAQATRTGALLIHGLYDCPVVMKDIGNALQSQGILVRSILLPGHGTVPGALLNTTYQEWIQTAEYGVHSLAKEVDSIFLVGFSTGGTIAINLALKNQLPKIAGMILLAPAIKISPLAGVMNLPPKLNKLSKRFDWFGISPETDYARYSSYTCNSAYQLYLLIQENEKLSQQKISCPTLIVISKDDETVCTQATLTYFQTYMSENSKLLIYTNELMTKDPRYIIRPIEYPAWRIQNISHIALPNSPTNKHSGIHGDYAGASHVEENLQMGSKYIYGTVSFFTTCLNILAEYNLYPKKYARLSFNPDYDFMQQTINNFIDIKRSS